MMRFTTAAISAAILVSTVSLGHAQIPPTEIQNIESSAATSEKTGTIRLAQASTRQKNNDVQVTDLLKNQNKADANAGTVSIMTIRNIGGPFMVAAHNLSTLLDSGEQFEEMRIIPIIARGKVQNLWDILYLRGVDVGFVQTDILEYLKDDPRYNSIRNRIRYITLMFPEEVHVVARKEIKSLQDLEGKTVSINAKGTGSSVVGTLLFRRLGINANLINEDTSRAIAKMKKGEIHAHFNVLGKPARPVVRIKKEDGLHLLPVPYGSEVQDVYLPSKFTSEDYPNLVPEGVEIPTIAAGNVLAVFNWPESHERYQKVAKFVDAFFSKFELLKQPGFHPKWKEVNLAAQVPGWTRFQPAQEWLDKNPIAVPTPSNANQLKDEFSRFLSESGISAEIANTKEMNLLFEKFLQWRSTRPVAQSQQQLR